MNKTVYVPKLRFPEFRNEQQILSIQDAMLRFLKDFDQAITDQATNKNRQSNEVDRAIFSLWRVISYNFFCVIDDFIDKRKFYSVSSSTRMILECVADASYLAVNPNQAASYRKNQDKIKKDLKNRSNNWQAFVSGDLNKHGKLQNITMKRIRESLGEDAVGAYNYLCFYSHPNIAGFLWLYGDKKANSLDYVLRINRRLIAIFVVLIEEHTHFDLDSQFWLQRLADSFLATSTISTDFKI